MEKFLWGKVIADWDYDFDGQVMNIVKYHPWIYDNNGVTKQYDKDEIEYSCQEINISSKSLQHLVILYFLYKNIGLNQESLASGIARAIRAI